MLEIINVDIYIHLTTGYVHLTANKRYSGDLLSSIVLGCIRGYTSRNSRHLSLRAKKLFFLYKR
jgi:hypothetical protein